MLILRLAFGGIMAVNHGFDKLSHFAGMAPKFPDYIGIGHTGSLALVVFAEFFCAAFLVLGLFTRLAAIPLVIAMGFAFFKAHSGEISGPRSGEMALLYLAAYIAILIMGPGKASLDRFLGK